MLPGCDAVVSCRQETTVFSSASWSWAHHPAHACPFAPGTVRMTRWPAVMATASTSAPSAPPP